jgi:hypothetical protein
MSIQYLQKRLEMAIAERDAVTKRMIELETQEGGNQIPYCTRVKTYMNALVTYGDHKQMVKCLEELAECQQAICKILIGGENFDHLAEEIADATITLEQMRLLFNINDRVCEYMDEKVKRLDDRLRREAHG